ncbi:MAG: crotonase/enoyl-CoA hydratase family protein [Myxococcota bacterium]|nr:crotonase/enoyl-CoA hydratase family protein [Myxococcota bacterium]
MEISLDITDRVALIRFDDGKKNAFTLEGIRDLTAAFVEAEANAQAIVLTGRPGSFCAGFDLATMMGDDKKAVRELGLGGGRLALRMYQCGKPLVAACTGHAFTIGCLWLLASDTRIGEDGRFKFSMIETQVGMPLTPWAFTLLEARHSKRHYTAAVVQSKAYDPHGAVDAGFLDEVVDEGEAATKALEAAAALAHLPASAYAANKLSTRKEGIEVMKHDLGL